MKNDVMAAPLRPLAAFALAIVAAATAGVAGCSSAPEAPDQKDRSARREAPADDGGADRASVAASAVGPRATAVPAETTRTRAHLKSYRVFEVRRMGEDGKPEFQKVAVGPEKQVLKGQSLIDVLVKEKITIPDEKTAREMGALLTDLLHVGNKVIESSVDYRPTEKRYDVVVVAINGGPAYGFQETVRWTFSLTPEARLLFSYRVVVDRRS